jgi:hypothetical protein
MEFVVTLSKLHSFSWTYGLGFRQQLVKAQRIIRMNAQNLAIAFARNVVYTGWGD